MNFMLLSFIRFNYRVDIYNEKRKMRYDLLYLCECSWLLFYELCHEILFLPYDLYDQSFFLLYLWALYDSKVRRYDIINESKSSIALQSELIKK